MEYICDWYINNLSNKVLTKLQYVENPEYENCSEFNSFYFHDSDNNFKLLFDCVGGRFKKNTRYVYTAEDYVRDDSRLTFAIRKYLYLNRDTGERTNKIKEYVITLHLPNRKVICECDIEGNVTFTEYDIE